MELADSGLVPWNKSHLGKGWTFAPEWGHNTITWHKYQILSDCSRFSEAFQSMLDLSASVCNSTVNIIKCQPYSINVYQTYSCDFPMPAEAGNCKIIILGFWMHFCWHFWAIQGWHLAFVWHLSSIVLHFVSFCLHLFGIYLACF